MTGQYQLVCARQGLKRGAAFQPFTHRIGPRLGRINPKIGLDGRQKLIAPDHQMIIAAPECGVIRRMALTETDIPIAPAHADHPAIMQAGKAKRQRMDHIAEVERPLGAAGLEKGGLHPCALPMGQGLGRWKGLFIQGQHARHQPRNARHYQLRAARLKPTR